MHPGDVQSWMGRSKVWSEIFKLQGGNPLKNSLNGTLLQLRL